MRKVNKNGYLILVLLVLLCIYTAYSALNKNLTINGTTDIEKNTWDIHFDNIKVAYGSITPSSAATIDSETDTVSFSVALQKPGDFYEFYVDAINDGTLNGMIESIEKTPELTEDQQKYLNYIIDYKNEVEIKKYQLVEAKSFVRFRVRVEYKKDIDATDLPTQSESLNLSFKVNYVQEVVGSGDKVSNNGVRSDIGDILSIGGEEFYVMGYDDHKYTLLSRYNLYVGGVYNSSAWTAYGSEATGRQDSAMIGFKEDRVQPYNGTTAFSSDSQKGTNYSDYSGSIVEQYVNNYKNYLQGITLDILEVRLPRDEDIEFLGCTKNGYDCESAPEWIYSTSYWLETPYNNTSSYIVTNNGNYGMKSYDTVSGLGVRPIVVIHDYYFE